jgi:hypothetical protein
MLSRWRLAEGGAGQVVLISGEPGIGKSRLVLALRERLESEPITLVSYACSPQHLNSPLFPFISQLEREVRFAPDDSSEERLKRLEALLCKNGQACLGMQSRSLLICLEFRARDLPLRKRCLRSKGKRSSSGRSWPGSIGLRRVAGC